jgi:hypothetical protein
MDRDDEELFEEAVSVAASFAYAIQTQESLLDPDVCRTRRLLLHRWTGAWHGRSNYWKFWPR